MKKNSIFGIEDKQYLTRNTNLLICEYTNYIGNNQPLITVLCTNTLLMNKINRNQIEINIRPNIKVLSLLEMREEIEDDILFSDIIVVYTTALKMAPEELTDMVEIVNRYKKKVFAIIGGWNQVGIIPENIKKKNEEFYDSFPNTHVLSIFAENEIGINGFLPINDIFENIASYCLQEIDYIRHEQERVISNHISGIINKDLLDVECKMNDELCKLNEYLDLVQKKHQSSQVTFKHAGADLIDVPEDIKNKLLNGISKDYNNYLNNKEETNIREYSKSVKNALVMKLEEILETGIYTEINESLVKKLEVLGDECVRDMLQVVSIIQRLNYVSEDKIHDLIGAVKEINGIKDYILKEQRTINEEIEISMKDIVTEIAQIQVEDYIYSGIEVAKKIYRIGEDEYKKHKYDTNGEETICDKEVGNCDSDEISLKLDPETGKWMDEFVPESKNGDKIDTSRFIQELDNCQARRLETIVVSICNQAGAIVESKVGNVTKDFNDKSSSVSVRFIDTYYNGIINILYEMKIDLERKQQDVKGMMIN